MGMGSKMEDDWSCDLCGHFGKMEYVHGKIQCPRCKQMPPMGDCCQGRPTTGEDKCSDGEKQ